MSAMRALTAVLETLVIPQVLPGGQRPGSVDVERIGPGVSLRIGGAAFFDQNGAPIVGDPDEAFNRLMAIRNSPDAHLQSPEFYHGGVRARVSTVYVGVDMGTHGSWPLVWETLVFVDDQIWSGWRYATRAAAHSGHAEIVAVLAAWVGGA